MVSGPFLKEYMDPILQKHLDKWRGQIDRMAEAEDLLIQLSSYTKSLYGKLFLASCKEKIAEKEAEVYSSDDWINHQKGVVAAQLRFNHEDRLLDFQKKELDCAYLSARHDHDFVKRS